MEELDKHIVEALSLLTDVPGAERLLAILSHPLSKPDREDDPVDLTVLSLEAESAVALLISTYGDDALDRARLLEKKTSSYFSRMVRRKLEQSQGTLSTFAD